MGTGVSLVQTDEGCAFRHDTLVKWAQAAVEQRRELSVQEPLTWETSWAARGDTPTEGISALQWGGKGTDTLSALTASQRGAVLAAVDSVNTSFRTASGASSGRLCSAFADMMRKPITPSEEQTWFDAINAVYESMEGVCSSYVKDNVFSYALSEEARAELAGGGHVVASVASLQIATHKDMLFLRCPRSTDTFLQAAAASLHAMGRHFKKIPQGTGFGFTAIHIPACCQVKHGLHSYVCVPIPSEKLLPAQPEGSFVVASFETMLRHECSYLSPDTDTAFLNVAVSGAGAVYVLPLHASVESYHGSVQEQDVPQALLALLAFCKAVDVSGRNSDEGGLLLEGLEDACEALHTCLGAGFATERQRCDTLGLLFEATGSTSFAQTAGLAEATLHIVRKVLFVECMAVACTEVWLRNAAGCDGSGQLHEAGVILKTRDKDFWYNDVCGFAAERFGNDFARVKLSSELLKAMKRRFVGLVGAATQGGVPTSFVTISQRSAAAAGSSSHARLLACDPGALAEVFLKRARSLPSPYATTPASLVTEVQIRQSLDARRQAKQGALSQITAAAALCYFSEAASDVDTLLKEVAKELGASVDTDADTALSNAVAAVLVDVRACAYVISTAIDSAQPHRVWPLYNAVFPDHKIDTILDAVQATNSAATAAQRDGIEHVGCLLSDAGASLLETQQHAESEQCLKEAVRLLDGVNSREALTTKSNLGVCVHQQGPGRRQEAIELYRSVMQEVELAEDVDDARRVSAKNNLASLLYYENDPKMWAESEALFTEALVLSGDFQAGDDDPFKLTSAPEGGSTDADKMRRSMRVVKMKRATWASVRIQCMFRRHRARLQIKNYQNYTSPLHISAPDSSISGVYVLLPTSQWASGFGEWAQQTDATPHRLLVKKSEGHYIVVPAGEVSTAASAARSVHCSVDEFPVAPELCTQWSASDGGAVQVANAKQRICDDEGVARHAVFVASVSEAMLCPLLLLMEQEVVDYVLLEEASARHVVAIDEVREREDVHNAIQRITDSSADAAAALAALEADATQQHELLEAEEHHAQADLHREHDCLHLFSASLHPAAEIAQQCETELFDLQETHPRLLCEAEEVEDRAALQRAHLCAVDGERMLAEFSQEETTRRGQLAQQYEAELLSDLQETHHRQHCEVCEVQDRTALQRAHLCFVDSERMLADFSQEETTRRDQLASQETEERCTVEALHADNTELLSRTYLQHTHHTELLAMQETHCATLLAAEEDTERTGLLHCCSTERTVLDTPTETQQEPPTAQETPPPPPVEEPTPEPPQAEAVQEETPAPAEEEKEEEEEKVVPPPEEAVVPEQPEATPEPESEPVPDTSHHPAERASLEAEEAAARSDCVEAASAPYPALCCEVEALQRMCIEGDEAGEGLQCFESAGRNDCRVHEQAAYDAVCSAAADATHNALGDVLLEETRQRNYIHTSLAVEEMCLAEEAVRMVVYADEGCVYRELQQTYAHHHAQMQMFEEESVPRSHVVLQECAAFAEAATEPYARLLVEQEEDASYVALLVTHRRDKPLGSLRADLLEVEEGEQKVRESLVIEERETLIQLVWVPSLVFEICFLKKGSLSSVRRSYTLLWYRIRRTKNILFFQKNFETAKVTKKYTIRLLKLEDAERNKRNEVYPFSHPSETFPFFSGRTRRIGTHHTHFASTPNS